MEVLKDNQEFWKKILGNKVYSHLVSVNKIENFHDSMPYDWFQEIYKNVIFGKVDVCDHRRSNLLFGKFQKVFLNTAHLYLKSKKVEDEILIWECIEKNLCENFEKIAVRVLIRDIHECKKAGLLMGENEQEEYRCYENNFLGNPIYINEICEKYPEMQRLLFLTIYQRIEFACEIVDFLKKDKPDIIDYLCEGYSFEKISKIEMGLSDAHHQGKTVTKILLDNGVTIIYKPHGLQKERLFYSLYGKYLNGIGFNAKTIRIICKEEYGWEEYVEEKECVNSDEIERYFQRLGVLLFICYCFDATDIHCQNILAHGEYPLLLDLETLPGVKQEMKAENAEQLVKEKIRHSVLNTGILPTIVWNDENGGAIVNALRKTKKVVLPFKLPVIVEPFLLIFILNIKMEKLIWEAVCHAITEKK